MKVHAELPEEDRAEGVCGVSRKPAYGARGAAKNFERERAGFARDRAQAAACVAVRILPRGPQHQGSGARGRLRIDVSGQGV